MGILSKITQKGNGQLRTISKAGGDTPWGAVVGGATNPSFTSFNNRRQQLNAYQDWVYAAAKAIAEASATIDLRIFINKTGVKNQQLGHKLVYNPKQARFYLAKKYSALLEYDKTQKKIVVRKDVPALEELEDHPLLDLLRSPNPFMTGHEFFELTFLHIELTGEAFWAITDRGKGNVPTEMWPLMPNAVSVTGDKDNFITGYVYNVGGKQIPFEPEDIIHHKDSNPNDLRRGMGAVQAAAKAIDTDAHAADYNRKFFYNSAQPDAVLETDSILDDDVYKRLKSEWEDRYGGTGNAHKTAILEQGLKYQPMALTQKEMDFLASRNFNRDMILAMFGVPKSIIGLTEDVNRATAETAEYVFTKNKIKPRMMRLCARITSDLAPQFGQELIISFTDPVPDDKEFLLKEKVELVNTLKTVNELRTEAGDLPVDGGDELFVSNLLVPLGTVAETVVPQGKPADAQEDDDAQNQDDDDTTDDDDDNDSPDEDHANPPEGKTAKKKDPFKLKTVEQKNQFAQHFEATRNRVKAKFEGDFLKASKKQFDRQKAEVMSNLQSRFANKTVAYMRSKAGKNDTSNLFDKDKAAQEWADAFIGIYQGAIDTMGDEAMMMLNVGDDVSFDSNTQAIKDYYGQRSQLVSKGIDDETNKQLQAKLTELISEGADYNQMSDAVESIYSSAAGFRADRIARTESMDATTFASTQAWEQSGVVESVEWHTAGAKPCDYCSAMDGQTIDIGSNFFEQGDSMTVDDQTMNFDFDSIDGPPLHANCECVPLPVVS